MIPSCPGSRKGQTTGGDRHARRAPRRAQAQDQAGRLPAVDPRPGRLVDRLVVAVRRLPQGHQGRDGPATARRGWPSAVTAPRRAPDRLYWLPQSPHTFVLVATTTTNLGDAGAS